MRYLSFTIKDFKGVKEATLDLEGKMEPGIYALVGLNESGKTTVLDAIKFLKDGLDAASLKATSLIPRRKRSSFTGSVSVSSKLKLSNKDKIQLEKLISKSYKNITLPEELTYSRHYHYEKSEYSGEELVVDMKIVASKKNSKKDPEELEQEKHPDLFEEIQIFVERALPPVVYYSDFLYDFPNKVYIDEGTTKPLEKFYKNVMEDVLASLNINLTINDLAERIKSPKKEHAGQVTTVVGQMQDKVTREVFSRWNDIFGRTHESARIEFEPDVEEGDKENPPRVFLKVRLIEGPDDFHITERSLGFKWFFSFLLLTIFRKARQERHEEILYLLDEPASNLHPTAQKKILETIKSLGEDNSKLVYTTHSHFLIDPEWLEGAFIIKNISLDSDDPLYSESKPTEIDVVKYRTFAANHPDQKEYFQPILDALDYQPSHLEMVEPLVITEGKFDYYTLTYLKKHFFTDYEYLNIYPGGGAGSNEEAISLYLAWAKDFCVLHDADIAGKKAKTKYLNRFGKILFEDRCLTYFDIDNNWDRKKMEDLFNAGDLLQIQQTLYPNENTYNKSHFNEAIQKLLIEGTVLQLGAMTISRFQKVFEALESRLPKPDEN